MSQPTIWVVSSWSNIRVGRKSIGGCNKNWQSARGRVCIDDRKPISVYTKTRLGAVPGWLTQIGYWFQGPAFACKFQCLWPTGSLHSKAIRAGERYAGSSLLLCCLAYCVNKRVHVIQPGGITRPCQFSILIGVPGAHWANQDASARMLLAYDLHNIVCASHRDTMPIENARIPIRGHLVAGRQFITTLFVIQYLRQNGGKSNVN